MHWTLILTYIGDWNLSLKTIINKGQWKKWHNFYLFWTNNWEVGPQKLCIESLLHDLFMVLEQLACPQAGWIHRMRNVPYFQPTCAPTLQKKSLCIIKMVLFFWCPLVSNLLKQITQPHHLKPWKLFNCEIIQYTLHLLHKYNHVCQYWITNPN